MRKRNKTYVVSIILFLAVFNVLVLKDNYKLAQKVRELENIEVKFITNSTTTEVMLNPVKMKIIETAERMGFEDLKLLFHLAKYESNFDPFAIGKNSNVSLDRGVFQWNDYYHPEVSNECAFDIECATEKTIELLKKGKCKEWTTCPL